MEEQSPFLVAHKFAFKVPTVLEIGTGSGIITTFIAVNDILGQKAVFFTTDLNPFACQCVKETVAHNQSQSVTLDPIQTNLASSLRDHQVDILVFNPPYVPAEEVPAVPCQTQASNESTEDDWLDLALLGGHQGMVVTNVLLDQLHNVLSANGIAYILFCASNVPEEVVVRPDLTARFDISLMEKRKCGWEVLSVYRFVKK
ncbi:hypothetical protein BABINDRAFT_159436 [Babjeviella inositovora NRRL Y-12698]|uniref:Methyltransferase small domain-containing protein n=1 Tax=Babjeviella inositovora NRRL Y-12698 TaxID=984486 RepID=A0A1E3QZ53_9ASCO|nr:uncharacterized protein BABINDRAFT_159436 [Babjeviella inositovora NRRL Y-12698]ODQ82959.1 hypothetical protein BABINDRAFT_159436 [Babjeviella inositovora NRRL Y-12698]